MNEPATLTNEEAIQHIQSLYRGSRIKTTDRIDGHTIRIEFYDCAGDFRIKDVRKTDRGNLIHY